MSTYQLPAETGINFSSGLDQLFVYVASQVPFLMPGLLFALFGIVFLGGIFVQDRRSGKSDAPKWFTVAGFVSSTMGIFMLLVDGLIPLTYVIINIAVLFIGVIWLFTSSDRTL